MRIRLLGVVEVWRDGADAPVPLGGLRLRGLLTRLALDAGRTVGVSTLVDDLWGEAPPDDAGNALQALVSRLRRAVGAELVARDAGGYRLRVEPDRVDALHFEAMVAAAANARSTADAHGLLRTALRLWRGPALADVLDLPFAAAAATRLADDRAGAVERCASLALGAGDLDPDLGALVAQLGTFPLRERTAALLARGLHVGGRQADALAVLDRTIALLADELGVDPGPELAAARLAVLRGERTPGPPATPGRPRPTGRTGPTGDALSSFVGRDHDVERVRVLLGSGRLVTLTGPGGAGKTRLAREAVAVGTAPARVAELAALTSADQLPAALLTAVGGATMLRSPDERGPDTVTQLMSALAGHDMVLVLDNCEHLVAAVAPLAETLLHACPRLRVLATSREPLGVSGEVLHPVDALAQADAERLFAERAVAVRPGFTVTADVEPVVREICRRLDGQPLPIELAAARLRTLSPTEIAARLDDRFRLLTSGSRTALPRHQTLRAVVDWSWDLLTEPERAVARRLGVFAGGATAATAERVCAHPSGPAPAEVFDLLAALVDKSLVVAVPQPEGGPTRYRMLETIREYAAERLDEAGERAAAVAAHARVVLGLAETAEPRLRGVDQLHWLGRLRAEADEIDLALRRSVAAGDALTAHRLVAAMGWAWLIQGLTDEARRWVEAVHALDGSAPPSAPLSARALNTVFLALLSLSRGDLAEAAGHVEAAIDLAAELPSPRHPMLELLAPVHALITGSDSEPARRVSEEAGDPWVRAIALQVRALVAENNGRIDEQRGLVRAAHRLFAAVGDRFGLGMVVFSLGELEDLAGNHEAAATTFDEAVQLATELGNEDDLPQFLTRRALLDIRRGDLDAAQPRLARATELTGDDRPSQSPVRWGLWITWAQLERRAGDLPAARAHLARADEALAHGGIAMPQRRAYAAMEHGAVELADGGVRAARGRLAEAVAGAVESEDGPVTAAVAELAARLALAEGDPERAGVLLGVARTQRGATDRGNPELLATHERVRIALGPAAAERAVRRGRELPRADGVAALADFARPPHDIGATAPDQAPSPVQESHFPVLSGPESGFPEPRNPATRR